MKGLSFTTMGTPKLNGLEAIQAARKYGFGGVDLRVSDKLGELTVRSSNAEIRELRDAFVSEGIVSPGILCYNETAKENDPNSWKRMEESVLQHLEIGQKLGSESIRLFSGSLHIGKGPGENIPRLAETLANALNRDKSDLQVVFQNHAGHANALQCAEVINTVSNPRLGLVFSPDHCVLQGEDLPQVYQVVKPITKQVYLSDVKKPPAEEKRKHKCVLPGEGDVPWKEAIDAMGGKAFGGWFTFKWEKIWHDELEEPEVALPHFVNHVSPWFA